MEVPLTAFMLACAGAAMITVSIVDLFMHIAEEIGLNHTLMMSITGALAEDSRTVMAFVMHVVGSVLCWFGLYYTPARVFWHHKLAGTSLPTLATVVSSVVGLMIVNASGSRSRFMLKYTTGVPNQIAMCLLMMASYCLNVFLIEHRQDKGFVTGIMDDSNTAFHCYTWGAGVSLLAHFAYTWYVPSRIDELKNEDRFRFQPRVGQP